MAKFFAQVAGFTIYANTTAELKAGVEAAKVKAARLGFRNPSLAGEECKVWQANGTAYQFARTIIVGA